jgi:transposase
VQALEPRVFDAVWQAAEGHLPKRPPAVHPLGCHRQRASDRECLYGIVIRLVTGCSWRSAARLSGKVSATTLRNRRSEWLKAGVYKKLLAEARAAYDKIIGLDLSEVAVDGSLHKAPCGGEGTGPNPTDRGKTGWKWSVATERKGIPIGWATDGANRHDSKMLEPTLDDVEANGLLYEIETLHLDRGYDSDVTRSHLAGRGITDVVCSKKRPRGTAKGTKNPQPLGMRWPVERTNSWFSDYGQLRRNTDRFIAQRLAEVELATTFILVIKLFAWADRWNR